MDVTSVGPVRLQEIVAIPSSTRREHFAVAANQTMDGQVVSVEGDTVIVSIGQQRVAARAPDANLRPGEALRLLVRDLDPDQVVMQIVGRGSSPATLRSLTTEDLSAELRSMGVAPDEEAIGIARALIARGQPLTAQNVQELRAGLARLPHAPTEADFDAAAFLKSQRLPITPDSLQVVRHALASRSPLGAQVSGLRTALADLAARLTGGGVTPAQRGAAQPTAGGPASMETTAEAEVLGPSPSRPAEGTTEATGESTAQPVRPAAGAPPQVSSTRPRSASSNETGVVDAEQSVETEASQSAPGTEAPAAATDDPVQSLSRNATPRADETPRLTESGRPAPAPADAPEADAASTVDQGAPSSAPRPGGAPSGIERAVARGADAPQAGEPIVVAQTELPEASVSAPAGLVGSANAHTAEEALPRAAAHSSGVDASVDTAPVTISMLEPSSEAAVEAAATRGESGQAERPQASLPRLLAAVVDTLERLPTLDERVVVEGTDELAEQIRRVVAEQGTPVEAKLARLLEGLASRAELDRQLSDDLKAALTSLVRETESQLAQSERVPADTLREMRSVHRQAEGLLADVELQQLANAAPRSTDPTQPSYLVFQLPLPGGRQGQGSAQIRIRQERDGAESRVDPRNMHVVFQLDLTNLGTVRVGLRVVDRHMSCQMGSTDPAATEMLRARSAELHAGLAGLGYTVDPIRTAVLTPEDIAPPIDASEPTVTRGAMRFDARI